MYGDASIDDTLVYIYVDVVCDLFHHGHIDFFRKARAFGDRLIVGVVGDSDVAGYKPRPIMCFDERVAVVRACRHVDHVLDSPAPLHCTRIFLDAIGATYCCHGDDMSEEELHYWYSDIMVADRLKIVAYTPEISSRQIVARIARRVQDRTL